jgi:hypothetical protein
MKKASIVLGIFIVLAFSFGSIVPQNGYDLFQKALAKERAEGNLEEAIALYQQVVKEAKDESLPAKAQLRIGICYEKLGKEKAKLAQEAFQRVVDNYPSQIEIVKVAKNKLNNLMITYSASKDFKIEKIGSGWWGNSIASNGRYLAFVDWGRGDLAIRDLITGKKRRLTDKGTWEESVAYALSPLWSSDEKKVAYVWVDDEKGYVDLRVIRIDGSKPRTLIRYKWEEGWVTPLDWSPSDDSILAQFSKEEGIDLGLVSFDDGSATIFKTIETIDGSLIDAKFSPNGRYILYNKPHKKNSRKRDIFLFSSA